MIHVIEEAGRCLQCRKPQCMTGCPISTRIPEMIALLKENRVQDAGRMLFENNPLSVVCSLVCDHQRQCEGHCVLSRKGQGIHISSIENYISETCLDTVEVDMMPQNGNMIAVIGGGPAGLTIAIEMRRRGYDVTIFDSRDGIGGVLRYGIPEFRLPKSILERYKAKLEAMGIRIRPNTTIGGALVIDDLLRDGYKAIFIGTGVWRPKKLGIAGESLGNVHFAIDFLVNPSVYDVGTKVAIIGAGNTAMDVARTVLRMKGRHEVTIYARRDVSEAALEEVEYARLEGARFAFRMKPVRIEKTGPVFVRTILDEEGRIIGEEPGEVAVEADTTFIAISQGPKSKLVDTTAGLKPSPNGLLLTDEKGETTRAGIFAAGDVVLGAHTVVEAVSYAKKVARSMDEYVRGLCGADGD